MADERYIWYEVEGEEKIEFAIIAHQMIMRERSKHLLEALARDGVMSLAKNVPNSPPYSTGYTLEHVGSSDVDWEPSALGGQHEAIVGIKAGTSYHPVYANRGTGIFGPWIKQPYTSLNGKLMWFYASRIGARIGREQVKGQRAQHFLYTTFRELQVFAQVRILTGGY